MWHPWAIGLQVLLQRMNKNWLTCAIIVLKIDRRRVILLIFSSYFLWNLSRGDLPWIFTTLLFFYNFWKLLREILQFLQTGKWHNRVVMSRDCLGSNPSYPTHQLSRLGLFLSFSVAQSLMMMMIMTTIAAIIGCTPCSYSEDTEIIHVVWWQQCPACRSIS